MKYAPYPAYKDSGIEWLGEIPAGWAVRRLKTLISNPITDGPHETPEFINEGVPFLSVDGIQDGELIFDGCRYISQVAHKEYRKKCAPYRDDILIGKAASTGKIARVKVDFEFSVWSPLALIRPNRKEVWPSFLEFSLKSAPAQAQIDILCTLSTQKNISMRDIPVLISCMPELSEQRAIASFLDRETTRIDALVAKKERLIELLQEKRTALITRAVTKGLDPNVPMKDSGVEWLGEIPAHWEVKRLKHLLMNRKGAIKTGPFGSQLQSSEMTAGEVKVYNQRSVLDRDFSNGDNYISAEKFEELRAFETFPDDLLITTRGSIGRCAVLPHGTERGILHPCLMRIQPDRRKTLPRFLEIQIEDCPIVLDQLHFMSNATTIDVIYSESLKEVWLPVPPLREQNRIVEFVDSETAKIDALISKVREAIDRLKELRTALISAAVTGKIDVREEVA